MDATRGPGSPGRGRAEQRGHRQSRQLDTEDGLRDNDLGSPDVSYGALDLGTNNCRLLIARRSRKGFDVIDAFSRIVRLGEGLGVNGSLGEPAMFRTIEALRVCSNKLKWHGVSRQRLIATEACRSASNGMRFIERVLEETGLALEVVDRESEAKLAAAGAAPLIDRDAASAVIFDIGGGSTEVMWMDRQDDRFVMTAWTSLAVGVVTLSERVGGGHHVSQPVYRDMRQKVKEQLAGFVAELTARTGQTPVPTHLLGTSGTVTTIAGVHLGLRSYDRTRVDGCWLALDDVGHVIGKLLDMSYEQRMQNGCIGRERADLVLAGCAILDEISAAFPARKIRVADRGLREGILSDLIGLDRFGDTPAAGNGSET